MLIAILFLLLLIFTLYLKKEYSPYHLLCLGSIFSSSWPSSHNPFAVNRNSLQFRGHGRISAEHTREAHVEAASGTLHQLWRNEQRFSCFVLNHGGARTRVLWPVSAGAGGSCQHHRGEFWAPKLRLAWRLAAPRIKTAPGADRLLSPGPHVEQNCCHCVSRVTHMSSLTAE